MRRTGTVFFGVGLGLFAMLVTHGCAQEGMSTEQLEALVAERLALAQAGPAEAPAAATAEAKPAGVEASTGDAPEASGEAPEASEWEVKGLSADGVARASATLALLKRLEVLMAGYAPALPEVPQNEVLECTTASQLAADAELGKLAVTLNKKVKAVKKERRQISRDFRRRISPLNWRIDHAWQTRFSTDRDEVKTYLYSDGPSPAPPELMRRMQDGGGTVAEPDRVHCIVVDFQSKGAGGKNPKHWLTCHTGPEDFGFHIELTSDQLAVQAGDLVSVPLAKVVIGEGVLRRERARKTDVWIVTADAAAVTVVEARTGCPVQKDIAGAMCLLPDGALPETSIIGHCVASGDLESLQGHLKRWDNKRIKDKNQTMLTGLGHLAPTRGSDLWVA
ncbi:MAG: hypothetical protein QF464_17600, partial [Myxococcota bacterium]|nr:hypothetical protein [Myxococcota bacterium]